MKKSEIEPPTMPCTVDFVKAKLPFGITTLLLPVVVKLRLDVALNVLQFTEPETVVLPVVSTFLVCKVPLSILFNLI